MRSYNVLIVDDSSSVRAASSFLRAFPKRWNMKVVRTKAEAAKVMKPSETDAVVLDLNLGPTRKHGLELLRLIRTKLEGVPVVALTEQDTDALIAAYADDDVAPNKVLSRKEVQQSPSRLVDAVIDVLYESGRLPNDRAILLAHGTDTMAWAFAYLRYALSDVTLNIAITGSQTPLTDYFSISDALGNLYSSVFLLNRVAPGQLFVVFDDGKRAFAGSLQKVRKWDANAFDGAEVARLAPEGFKLDGGEWRFLPYRDQKLEELHLIRTGGTIESEPDAQGALLPSSKDFIYKCLANLGGAFSNITKHDVFALDSSNMTLPRWEVVARRIAEIAGDDIALDVAFERRVLPVLLNPLLRTEDYRRQFRGAAGIIILGYGGGNGNTDVASGHSVIPAIASATSAGIPVVVTSQVPLETYDMAYSAGRELLTAGALPSGSLSLAEAQMKLSFLLGHREELTRAAEKADVAVQHVIAAAFLSGVQMRTEENRRWYLQWYRERHGVDLPAFEKDPFVLYGFSDALEMVVSHLTSSGERPLPPSRTKLAIKRRKTLERRMRFTVPEPEA